MMKMRDAASRHHHAELDEPKFRVHDHRDAKCHLQRADLIRFFAPEYQSHHSRNFFFQTDRDHRSAWVLAAPTTPTAAMQRLDQVRTFYFDTTNAMRCDSD